MNILQLLVSLSILVFIHELGHFAMARLFGTRVEKFYLFFNPWFSLFKYTSRRSGTTYGLGWLPLGGYCQIAGMVDESMDTEQLKSPPKPDEFRSKPAWQRLLIMAGGIIFNLILAFALYCMVAYSWGDKHLDTSRARYGWSFAPVAEEVGFRDGDIILSIDGETGLNALDRRLNERLIQAHTVVVERNGAQVSISIPQDMMQRVLRAETGFSSPRMPFVIDSVVRLSPATAALPRGAQVVAVGDVPTPDISDVPAQLAQHRGELVDLTLRIGGTEQIATAIPVDSAGTIGVMMQGLEDIYPIETIRYSLLGAIPAGYHKAVATIHSYTTGLKYIFTKEGAQSLGGLGTMAKLFPSGFDWYSFWMTTAFLSIILAVMNLLPIPALDGGHILFLIIEMVTRRKLNDKAMTYVQMAGMILLLILMLYANLNDIYRYLIR